MSRPDHLAASGDSALSYHVKVINSERSVHVF
jgi:hypothetical protein